MKTITINVDETTAAAIEKFGILKILNLGIYQANYRSVMQGRKKLQEKIGKAMSSGQMETATALVLELKATYSDGE